jgi:hypothetical protein
MKTKILSILALLLMTVTQGAWAQETLTVYDGTADNQYIPMYGYSFDYYTKSECIIPASELTAMEGGTITAITFYAKTLTGSNTTFGTANQKVFLKEVSGTTLSSYSGMTDATVVFDGTLPMPTTSASGYTITFSQGYTYNGGNLLIGIYNAAKGSWKTVRWYGIDNQSSGVSAYGYHNDNLANAAFKAQQFLPKTTFTYTPAPTAVDLGLPSGKKWADRNVGALSATGYGTYYAWSSSDIATAQWGNDWRMPTLTEAQELINNTDQEWATIGGVNGTKFMKKTDHSVYIFVPAAGWDGSGNGNIGTAGAYWTSTAQNESRAYEFAIRASGNATGNDNMTHQFTIRPVQMFAGEGTEASPYLIASTTDWNNLSAAVIGGENYLDKHFKLTANISVTTMIGASDKPFSGTFDGQGHTLTVSYTASTHGTAPFPRTASTTLIKNLHVAGTITGGDFKVAGLVSEPVGATIEHCRVSATISANAYHGLWIGGFCNGGNVTIKNCLFDGKINCVGGGFIGYSETTSRINNCLFAPQTGSSLGSSQDGNGVFIYTKGRESNLGTITNSYYTSLAGGVAQGTDGSGMNAAQLVENLGPSNWKEVDGNAIPKVHPNLSGLGTQTSPYLIASTTDWNNLVSAVNAGEAYSGNYFKMTANVGTVSTWMTGTFSGTFDGDGKTLTVGYSNTTADVMCAPFGTLNGATIQNLKVAGSISSNQRLVAGIAALCSSTGNSVTNCLVSATINSSYSGNAADGGLVAVVENGASLNVTGCAFAGKLLGGDSYASGGIVGWRRTTDTCTLTNCLYAPASATGSEVWMTSEANQDGSANFCRYQTSQPAPTITNCYYTTDFSSGIGLYTAQGIQARSISAGDYVSTLAISGDATATYDVSGITVYSTGISFNDGSTTTFYGGSGQTVSLALTAETRTGYQFKQYAASQGSLSGQTTDAPTLTMPAATGETLYTTYTATAGPDGVSDKSGYAKLVDNDKSTKVCATFTSGVYIDFNTPNAIVPTGYVITTANDASSEYWRNRSPKTWKLYGKLNEGDSWTVLDDVADGNLPNEDTKDVSYSIANTAAYKYFRYEISAIKGSTELFQLAELQLKGYDAVVISAEYDPTYNADFADGNDNTDWTIDPTQQIEGGTVTVSYTGENKVKSVTVTKLALCSLSEVTSEHVGKIIGADGNVYASLAQAEKVTSAVGVLGKVTETGHGLIMSLEDAPQQVWATIDGWASASYAGTTLKVLPDDDARGSNLPSYTMLGSTTVSNWAVATRADYTAIFTNLGSTRTDSDGITYDEHVNAYITDAGGTAISGENWSSTGYSDVKAWRFSYDNKWGARDKTTQFKVRPVLGF